MTVRPESVVRSYELRHIVCFAETNLVGNVYFTRHLEWQGRCREMFLRDHCPELLELLATDLALVTLHCHCDYLVEVRAFDEVIVRMRLGSLTQSRITLEFEYFRREPDGAETLVARGEQHLATMRREGQQLVAAPIPAQMREALSAY